MVSLASLAEAALPPPPPLQQEALAGLQGWVPSTPAALARELLDPLEDLQLLQPPELQQPLSEAGRALMLKILRDLRQPAQRAAPMEWEPLPLGSGEVSALLAKCATSLPGCKPRQGLPELLLLWQGSCEQVPLIGVDEVHPAE
jgi:hypothetical protein